MFTRFYGMWFWLIAPFNHATLFARFQILKTPSQAWKIQNHAVGERWLDKTRNEIFVRASKVRGVDGRTLEGHLSFSFILHAFHAEKYHFVLFQVMIDLGMLNCLRLRKRPSKKRYKLLNDSLLNSPLWPPLSQPLSSPSYSVIHIS